jgi:hypothetical protein
VAAVPGHQVIVAEYPAALDGWTNRLGGGSDKRPMVGTILRMPVSA